jgi:penicillin-binding protein 1A
MAPHDRVLDAPIQIGRWKPDNYRGKYYGEVTLTEALARSLNSATVRLQEYSGRSAVRAAAKRMGLDPETHGPALALGVDAVTPLELAGAYAPFANGGLRAPVHAIESIRTIDGQPVYRRPPPVAEYAAAPAVIEQMNAMLRAIPEWGTGRAAALAGYAVAGKTGTTQDSRDAWFAGHAGGLVGVVWTGRDNYAPMQNVTGGTAPAILWREIFARALPTRPAEAFPQPAPPPAQAADPDDPLASLLREAI